MCTCSNNYHEFLSMPVPKWYKSKSSLTRSVILPAVYHLLLHFFTWSSQITSQLNHFPLPLFPLSAYRCRPSNLCHTPTVKVISFSLIVTVTIYLYMFVLIHVNTICWVSFLLLFVCISFQSINPSSREPIFKATGNHLRKSHLDTMQRSTKHGNSSNHSYIYITAPAVSSWNGWINDLINFRRNE